MKVKRGFIPIAILAVLSVVGMGGTGAAVASQGSVPGDGLYPVKTLTEDVRLITSFGEEGKIRTQLAIAEEKLNEIEKLQARGGRDEDIVESADRYGVMISSAAENVANAARSGEGSDEALAELVAKATSIHFSVLADVYTKVPDQAKPAIERAMQQSEIGATKALNALNGKPNVDQIRQEVQQRVNEAKQQRGMPEGIEPGAGMPDAIQQGTPQGVGQPQGVGNTEESERGGGPPANIPGGRP
ncbi:MAG: DUF5667 domain-containing protein [Candidatus Curtissbacteria bacterium]